ncbi:MAG: RluA family pseudouridine synthase [Terriglobia bacterium]
MSEEIKNPHSRRTQELVAGAEDAGIRLDILLSRRLPDWSRSQLQKLVRSGRVRIGARAARKAGEAVVPGERIAVCLEWDGLNAAPEPLPLDVIYEDADFAVVNKPAGMVVHAGAGVKSGTLVNALLHHMPHLSSAAGVERPGIVHRLDRMTSGLILVAKNDAAHRKLAADFKARAVYKTYITLVHGRVKLDDGVIDAPIGRDPIRRVRMKTGGIRPRPAVTEFHVLRRFPGHTLLQVSPRTGRTHQIRVHLASRGHPVAGDVLYGSPAPGRGGAPGPEPLARTFLHASALQFRHPRTAEQMSFEAPLPQPLQDYLDHLTARR